QERPDILHHRRGALRVQTMAAEVRHHTGKLKATRIASRTSALLNDAGRGFAILHEPIRGAQSGGATTKDYNMGLPARAARGISIS
ncbi:MAG: hypothetical protein WD533_03080, partial [Dehalococcoidia bacterium]